VTVVVTVNVGVAVWVIVAVTVNVGVTVFVMVEVGVDMVTHCENPLGVTPKASTMKFSVLV
jgi:hypothetical protein